MTAPGRLRHRLTLQSPPATQDALGQPTNVFVTVDTVWGDAEPLRGMQWLAAGGEQAAVTVKFTIRWRADVAPGWRVLWNGRPYDVAGEPIDAFGRGRWLELMAKATHGGQ
jgi:SPP1 family predicted phage head-tail adaptor